MLLLYSKTLQQLLISFRVKYKVSTMDYNLTRLIPVPSHLSSCKSCPSHASLLFLDLMVRHSPQNMCATPPSPRTSSTPRPPDLCLHASLLESLSFTLWNSSHPPTLPMPFTRLHFPVKHFHQLVYLIMCFLSVSPTTECELYQEKYFVSWLYPQDPEQWLMHPRNPKKSWKSE